MIEEEIKKQRMMGPDSFIIIDELLKEKETDEKIRILDLGCGKGLTSLYLSEKYKNAEIFAVDLWVDAKDNYIFFKENNADNRIIPLNCSAEKMPFAENYFDIIVSIDSYHYFGLEKDFFKHNIKLTAAVENASHVFRGAVFYARKGVQRPMGAHLAFSQAFSSSVRRGARVS